MATIKDLARRLISGDKSPEQTGEANERAYGERGTMTRTTLAVEGMSCGHCTAAVEGELSKLDGVERSEADFEKNAVEVRYDGERVTAADLRGAVERAGYRVSG